MYDFTPRKSTIQHVRASGCRGNGRVWNSVYLLHFYSSIVRFYLHLWAGVRVLILDHLVVFLSDHCNLDQELSMNNHKFFTGLGWIFTINSYTEIISY